MDKTSNTEFDFDAVFNADDYLYFYGDFLTEELTCKQVAFLENELSLKTGMPILDLACGHGRHANKLATKGYNVTAVDRSRDFLDIAQKNAPDTNIKYLCQDMRNIEFEEQFDRVLLMFTAFGYFNDDENLQVLKNVAKALKPGGLLCMDFQNRDAILCNLKATSFHEKGEDLMLEKASFDSLSGRLYNKRVVIRDGKRKEMPYFVRLYNATELKSLLNKAGLSLIKLYSNFDADEFQSMSYRMIVVAQKS